MRQQRPKHPENNHDSHDQKPGPWFECRTCRGDEGQVVNGHQWENCETCEGQGGWPEDIYADTTS